MVYQSPGFVLSVLSSSKKPIRESKDGVCRIEFDSEYILRLKNKTKLRAYASISIDGMDISPGRRFVLKPGETVDVERFIYDGNLTEGKKFKFISLAKGAATCEIQDPSSEENGNISVTFEPEVTLNNIQDYTTLGGYRGGSWSSGGSEQLYGAKGGGILRGMSMGFKVDSQTNGTGGTYGTANYTASNSVLVNNCVGTATGHIEGLETHINNLKEEVTKGATAEGSKSDQKFTQSTDYFLTGIPITLKLQLRGMLPLSEPEFKPSNSYLPTQVVVNELYKLLGEEKVEGYRKAIKALIQDYENRIP